MKKRVLSLALAVVLCAGLMPMAAAYDTGAVTVRGVVSAGDANTAVVKNDGSLWMWGSNDMGAGGSTVWRVYSNVPKKFMDHVASVSCGHNHTAVINTDGSLWTWGYNELGALGDGTSQRATEPVKIMDNVASVSCGDNVTAAIKTDGSLWVWGYNLSYQVDGSESEVRSVPQKVMDCVTAVSVGSTVVAALKADGTLWMWGYNGYGAMGFDDDEVTFQKTPIQVLDRVTAISCGGGYTAAIRDDGTLWTWGKNDFLQLGNGGVGNKQYNRVLYQTEPLKIADHVASVHCSNDYTAAIKTDGSLWVCGVDVGQRVLEDELVKVMDDVLSVGCGSDHIVAVKPDGTVWTWGLNDHMQLGNGGTGNKKNEKAGYYYQTVPEQIMDGAATDIKLEPPTIVPRPQDLETPVLVTQGRLGDRDELGWSYKSDGKLTITQGTIPAKQRVLVSGFDEMNCFLGVEMLTAEEGEALLRSDAARFKLIWLNEECAPQCASKQIVFAP